MASHAGDLDLQAVVLAAGKSSRFKTGRTKLVEKICGREMVLYPTGVLASLNVPVVMVVGFQHDAVEETVQENFGDTVTFVHQKEQLGTGHAIECTQDAWNTENILILNGDMPLITKDIIQKLARKHTEADATVTFATAHHCDPEALYGRVIQADDDIQIVEAKDFEGDLSENCCVNAGVYIIKRSFLNEYISQLRQHASTKEWYITDLIQLASKNKLKVQTVPVPFDRIRGVNDFKELWAAEQIKKSEIIQYWMSNGVRFSIAHNVQIDWNVTIGAGSFIGSGVQLLRNTTIGKDCVVGAFSFLRNVSIGNRTKVHTHSVVAKAEIGNDCNVGPFAFVHGNSVIKDNATIGSFVEINRSEVGKFSKAKHLSYLGDTTVEEHANIGAGVVACNYDGANKHKTRIKDGAFIGGNNTLVAPVTVGKKAITAAGSTITHDVPNNALGIAREHQVNKEEYAEKIRKKNNTQVNRPSEDSSFAHSGIIAKQYTEKQ